MSEFYVNESGLERAAGRIRDLDGQVAPAVSYAQSNLDLTFGDTGVLLSTVLATTGPARSAVIDTLREISTHLATAARELDATAAAYRQTDDSVDRRLDETYAG